MSFNVPADFTKKMLWGLWPIMTCRMMLKPPRKSGPFTFYRSLPLAVITCGWFCQVMALLVFIGSAGAQSLPEPLGAADVIQYKRPY
jgi:hypothetical protein